ncbi:tetratricopeptide repeat protein [Desulfogranum marinum]|uniref:tetratricopeptide repeat protein n=1 Tax=Desulfogranum marinum TaxID=453220 RepID=UPI0029C82813|nr:tetratricopeptide repeat protein [Desulfogranum marinum]
MVVDKRLEQLQQLYTKALDLHSLGEFSQAIALYEEVTGEIPDADTVQYNLGLALYHEEEYEKAKECFQQAAAVNKSETDYWFNLALTCNKLHLFAEAVAAYKQALALRPDDVEILYSLGCCCKECGATEEAVQVYSHVLELDPSYAPALNNLAYLLHLHDDHENAVQNYQQLLEIDPDHAGAKHMIAALKGETSPAKPPEEYVRSLFDSYSETFEESLVGDLDYRAPERLWNLFNHGPRKKKYEHCIDLGCGTGLCGELFRECSDKLTGIDLSPKMIDIARQKQIYDTLEEAELIAYFHQHHQDPAPFDLVLAADVFIYLGDLKPVFQAITAGCRDEVHICFSIESGEGEDWMLHANGRYSHSHDYILAVAKENDLQVCHFEQVALRQEKGGEVKGLVYFLRAL